MRMPIRRTGAAIAAVLALGIGSAVWATSSASAAPGSSKASTSTAYASTTAASKTAASKTMVPAQFPPICTARDLAVWVNLDAMNGAAGTWYYPLEFTNTSDRTCRIWGWPGVSATNADGKQLGDAAARDNLYAGAWVNIASGGTAHALLGYRAAEVETSGCKPTDATAVLKAFAPGSTTANHAFFDLPACTVGGKHRYLTVTAIVPGTNI